MRRFFLHSIFKTDDPPHRLALGVAIGVFVTFMPTIGFQMVMVVALAWLFGANKLAGLPVTWISNPATLVPIYYPAYRLGKWILGGPPVKMQWWKELAKPPDSALEAVRFYWGRMLEIIEPLTVGCLLIATPIAGVAYVLTYQAIDRYRAIRAKRKAKLHPATSADQAAAEAPTAGIKTD